MKVAHVNIIMIVLACIVIGAIAIVVRTPKSEYAKCAEKADNRYEQCLVNWSSARCINLKLDALAYCRTAY